MIRRTAIQVLMLLPFAQLLRPQDYVVPMSQFKTKKIIFMLDKDIPIEIQLGAETIIIKPEELFEALKK